MTDATRIDDIVSEYAYRAGDNKKDWCVVTECKICGNLQVDGKTTPDEKTWQVDEGYADDCYSCGKKETMSIIAFRKAEILNDHKG